MKNLAGFKSVNTPYLWSFYWYKSLVLSWYMALIDIEVLIFMFLGEGFAKWGSTGLAWLKLERERVVCLSINLQLTTKANNKHVCIQAAQCSTPYDPSFRKSLPPKHENWVPECPSSLTESTAQASCLAVMRFGDYHSNASEQLIYLYHIRNECIS